MSLSILGIATALPQHSIDQERAARLAGALSAGAENDRRIALLYRRSGVKRRHSVLLTESPNGHGGAFDGQSFYRSSEACPTTADRMAAYAGHALPLAAESAAGALHDADVAPGEITHLITVSCSGFNAPGIDIQLIGALGLSPGVARTHVGFMGCHGALNALRVADAFMQGNPAARVLVCAVELCSLHYQYSDDAEKHVANSLFADGAAALVTGGKAGKDWRLVASASHLIEDSLDAMTWTIGDHGFAMTLSPRVPQLIGEHLRPWVESFLARHGMGVAGIGSWAIHPGGPRILQAAQQALALPAEATALSREVLAAHGNMSSPTILFLLKRLMQSSAPMPCVALAFGPGLVAEAALFDRG